MATGYRTHNGQLMNNKQTTQTRIKQVMSSWSSSGLKARCSLFKSVVENND